MAWTAVPTYAVGDPWTAAAVNTYIRDNLNYLTDSLGQMQPTAASHKFGANAAGGSGTRIRLGSAGDPNNAWLIGEGSGTNVGLTLQPQGTGGVLIQDASGLAMLGVQTPSSALTSGQTGIITLAYHNGTSVVRQRVTVGAADSGGTGFKLLRVPN